MFHSLSGGIKKTLAKNLKKKNLTRKRNSTIMTYMTAKRMEALISGYELPSDVIEDIFLYTFTAAVTGSKLFDIYMELADNLDEEDPEAAGAIIVAYALAEKQIANGGEIKEGDMQ